MFAARKPVLAICYGMQSLNVYLGGNLVQDIFSEVPNALEHRKDGQTDRYHDIVIERGTRLERLAGAAAATVNTSHHQAVARAAQGMVVTARAPDNVIEAMELENEQGTSRTAHWVTGVQWHPERLEGDRLAEALFREFVEAARGRR
jgi:putative glutamine amidotransferase